MRRCARAVWVWKRQGKTTRIDEQPPEINKRLKRALVRGGEENFSTPATHTRRVRHSFRLCMKKSKISTSPRRITMCSCGAAGRERRGHMHRNRHALSPPTQPRRRTPRTPCTRDTPLPNQPTFPASPPQHSRLKWPQVHPLPKPRALHRRPPPTRPPSRGRRRRGRWCRDGEWGTRGR